MHVGYRLFFDCSDEIPSEGLIRPLPRSIKVANAGAGSDSFDQSGTPQEKAPLGAFSFAAPIRETRDGVVRQGSTFVEQGHTALGVENCHNLGSF